MALELNQKLIMLHFI